MLRAVVMNTAVDLDEQRRIFEDLRRRYPPEEAEAALQELLAARMPLPSRESAAS